MKARDSEDSTTFDTQPNSISDWARKLDQAIDQRFDELTKLRRHIHMHPEPSGEEVETTAFVARHLRDAGLEVAFGPDNKGLVVEVPGMDKATGTKRIALRADMDALRIQDAKATAYRSTVPHVMHACGHDGHTTVVAGALLGLAALHDQNAVPWPVCVRGIFQPAEETSRGARDMIGAGALEEVSAILSTHLDPSREVGTIGVRVGAFTAACDEFDIRIEGRGGHAARPHESLDPIAAAAQLISSLYLFVPRAIDSQDPVVVTIGYIQGGDNANVIPEEVLLKGTLRTLGGIVREQTMDHIRKLARGMAETAGVEMTVTYKESTASVRNDHALTSLIRQAAGYTVGVDSVEDIDRPSMGGEDFAEYLDHVPGCMFRLGCKSDLVPSAPLHSPHFDLDERSIAIGAKILARAVIMWSQPNGPNDSVR